MLFRSPATIDVQPQNSNFGRTDSQIYAERAQQFTPTSFRPPKNMGEVSMYKEGMARGMTIDEIKYERQQQYLSRFNSDTRSGATRRLFNENTLNTPSLRQAMSELSAETAARQDPYSAQRKGSLREAGSAAPSESDIYRAKQSLGSSATTQAAPNPGATSTGSSPVAPAAYPDFSDIPSTDRDDLEKMSKRNSDYRAQQASDKAKTEESARQAEASSGSSASTQSTTTPVSAAQSAQQTSEKANQDAATRKQEQAARQQQRLQDARTRTAEIKNSFPDDPASQKELKLQNRMNPKKTVAELITLVQKRREQDESNSRKFKEMERISDSFDAGKAAFVDSLTNNPITQTVVGAAGTGRQSVAVFLVAAA